METPLREVVPQSPSPAIDLDRRRCLNCDEPLAGPFCSACGQRDVPPRPTLRELLGEAFAEFSGWDGKLANTLRLLVTRPGQLTVDFLQGRRARYITPLRLYLSVSLVYFVLAAAAPEGVAPAKLAQATNGGARNVTIDVGGRLTDQLSADDREQIRESIASAPALLRPALRRLADDPIGFHNELGEMMPKLMFALLPVFALIVALFYRRKGFVEHLYFTINLQTFFFVALGMGVLARFTHLVAVAMVAGTVAFIWMPLYAHLALKRVYGGPNGATALKELGIGALYALVYVPAVVMLALWVGKA